MNGRLGLYKYVGIAFLANLFTNPLTANVKYNCECLSNARKAQRWSFFIQIPAVKKIKDKISNYCGLKIGIVFTNCPVRAYTRL